VLPVRYEQKVYTLLIRNSVFKGLRTINNTGSACNKHEKGEKYEPGFDRKTSRDCTELEKNIEMILEIWCDYLDWIHLA
jgi:hypothetical protein